MTLTPPVILVANGVNLDLLGKREPDIYGSETAEDLEKYLMDRREKTAHLAGFTECRLKFFQSNHEGEFLDHLSQGWDGIIINPGAWTHTSLALGDRLAGLGVPYIEVHLSKLSQREIFRQQSFTAGHALGVIHGLGFDSYFSALLALLSSLKKKIQK